MKMPVDNAADRWTENYIENYIQKNEVWNIIFIYFRYIIITWSIFKNTFFHN